MSRPSLLDALDAALGKAAGEDFRHHSPPAEPPVATANPLNVQGIHHLRHFRHLDDEKPAADDIESVSGVITDAAVNKHRVIQPKVYLLEKESGESGKSPKTDAVAVGYLSPPASVAVANGGEGGDRRGSGSALLAQLTKALQPEEPAADPSPPVISAARRLNLTAAAAPPPELLEPLGDNKAELVALLTGDHCRCCGHPIARHRLGAGLTYADGTSECMACADSPTPANRTPGPGALAGGAAEKLTPTQEGADPGPAWTDIDAWCRRIGALSTVAERRVVLREWVAAAGGWSDAAAIHLPVALPKGLALARLKAHARALGMQILEDEDDPELMAWLRGAK